VIAANSLEQRPSALIDTGAVRCYFPRGVGEALGFKFSAFDKDFEAEIGGAPRPVQMKMVTLSLPGDPAAYWETEVAFFLEEWQINYGILGQQGFLDRFVVSFNYSANYFVVETVESWDERTPPDPFEEFQKEQEGWWRPRPD